MSVPDIDSLYDLYHALGGEKWTHSDEWLSIVAYRQRGVAMLSRQTTPHVYGVEISRSQPHQEKGYYGQELHDLGQYVAALKLPFNNLAGVIPPSIGSLTHIRSIELFGNRHVHTAGLA
jgi:hypothetical protein